MNQPISTDRSLRPRERLVLQLMADGHPHKVVASKMGVALSTVNNQVRSLKLKLGATTLPHAVAIGLKQGVITHEQH